MTIFRFSSLHLQVDSVYIPVFRLVAAQGSFKATANALNVRSSVSKKISQLESLVGQRLFQRTTRKLVITESGQQLLCISEGLPTLLDGISAIKTSRESKNQLLYLNRSSVFASTRS
jgi:DNA-binding transcriptional LysR family regulator